MCQFHPPYKNDFFPLLVPGFWNVYTSFQQSCSLLCSPRTRNLLPQLFAVVITIPETMLPAQAFWRVTESPNLWWPATQYHPEQSGGNKASSQDVEWWQRVPNPWWRPLVTLLTFLNHHLSLSPIVTLKWHRPHPCISYARRMICVWSPGHGLKSTDVTAVCTYNPSTRVQ